MDKAVGFGPSRRQTDLSLVHSLEEFYPECEAVFAYEGQRLMDLKRAWKTACEKAKVNGLLSHDMRRSANRNMRDAGLPQPMPGE